MTPSSSAVAPAPSRILRDVPVGLLLRLLRRNLWLIALCAAVCAVAAWGITRTLPRYYIAEGSITVEGDTFAIPELRGALRTEGTSEPMPLVRSEVQALYGRQLLEGVINQLGLARMPEFNPALRPRDVIGTVRDLLGALLPGAAPGGGASPDAAARAEADAVLATVVRNLVVFNDNRSLVIRISFTAEEPEIAAGFVNALVKAYVATRGQGRSSINQGANAAIGQQTEQVRKEIAALEDKARELRRRSGLTGLPNGGASQQQLTELATASARAGIDAAQLQATYGRAVALQRQGVSDELAGVLGSSTVSQLRAQEAQASRRLAELSTRYGGSYPSVISARADLAAAHREVEAEVARIIASLGTQLRVARQHEADAQKQMEDARAVSVRGANDQAELDDLQQEIRARRTLYQTLLDRLQQTTTQAGAVQTPDIRVLSAAAVPGFPAGPSGVRAGLLGGLGGAVLGCLFALLRVRSVGAFPDPQSVAAVGLPVLAVLPGGARGGPGAIAARVLTHSTGPDAEALRALRARLRLAVQGSTPRSVVFTSAGEGEGAAGIAAAFARLAALDGERALLIEGDLRAPALARLLGASAGAGTLVPVLEARHRWRDALARDSGSGLDMLLAGQRTASSHALLSGSHLQNLLMEAREHYTLIVLNAPPAATTADALALAHQADVAVLVIDGEVATRPAVTEAASRLRAAAQHLAGAALIPA